VNRKAGRKLGCVTTRVSRCCSNELGFSYADVRKRILSRASLAYASALNFVFGGIRLSNRSFGRFIHRGALSGEEGCEESPNVNCYLLSGELVPFVVLSGA
jgi:hypothetical protein